ncbi:hypothetical protein COV24_02495 [candidate division WWE3 bacterium CG10_big_fil_rev_8_21_14_0_10_32_10]|uniref:Membrane insertase YidC/Oxa/ALB C-terminal domain-containing protein n=1 Tax=candidate division WWE3 bacterium CG10_big_fil_rev_8_21_14_0_10_32_10 TaxID=1975090 RepID=A0A2H0RAD6_UNCKA|nr:MAG: hypothetical protein COV24_02495 [candidate division WWE3 bacterium CG10_big_fil_rev_8_21_14_0_10_32_10]
MLNFIWTDLLTKPIFNLLVFLDYYTGNLGISIILLTLILKTLLFPTNIPNIKMSSKKGDLDEELRKLKEKYTDKSVLAQKQMEIYKKHGINPASGCLPNILQFLVLIALYRVFINTLHNGLDNGLFYFKFLENASLNLKFLYLDLSKPDPLYILPVLAGIVQFVLSKSLLPTAKKVQKIAEKTPSQTDDVMSNMQEQMIYIAPIMTVFIGATLPSGLALYWFISSLYSFLQTYLLKRFYTNRNIKKD